MDIEHYSFGKIVIKGNRYSKDVIIFSDRVLSPWWRQEGHYLRIEDLEEALKEEPEVLVIGKGYFGMMAVPDELVAKLSSNGIQIIAQKSSEAVKTFNNLSTKKKIAALHLTC
ncbi:MAG: Mth938-like domain-containing protein [Dissulfurispiraceae bacterium]